MTIQPDDLDGERTVLGAIFLKPELLSIAAEQLQPVHLADVAHRVIYEAMLEVSGGGKPIDTITVADEIKLAGDLDRLKSCGGANYLVDLQASVVTVDATNVAWHVNEIWRRYQRRLVKGLLKTRIEDVQNDEDVDDLIERTQFDLEKAKSKKSLEQKTGPRFELVPIRDIPEIVTQDWLIDGLVPRFPEGAAGYIFGPAKARKSLLLADMALSVASGTQALSRYDVKHTGTVVGFFAEDPRGETSRRIHRMARARGIPVPGNLHLINTPAICIDSLEHQEKLIGTLTAIPDLAMVWLDPMVRLHRVNDNRAEELGPIHTFLRTLSRACPSAVIILAHHANKDGDSRGSTDYNAFGDFNVYCKKKDALTTEIVAIENRGGPPGTPFSFVVEDGYVDQSGATMKLIASDIEDQEDNPEHDMALEQAIIAYRDSNPHASTREGKKHLRALGLKVGSDKFWALWKSGC